MRLYVELVNQRYDDQGKGLGKFKPEDWAELSKRLDDACRSWAVEMRAPKAESYETGTGAMTRLPASVALLLTSGTAKDLGALLKLRSEVEEKGGVLRVLKAEDLSEHAQAIASTLSGEHGFERHGAHFTCVAGDGCGLKVYQGDPGYEELVAIARQTYEGGVGHECETNDCDDKDCHRCFPRADCPHHAKCREFTANGDAYTDKQAKGLATKRITRRK